MNNQSKQDDKEKAEMLSELVRLTAEVRQRLLDLLERSGVSDEFKTNTVVKEWVK